MSDIQQGFKPAEFHGVFLEQNGPFYVKKTDACWLVGLSIEEHHANYLAIETVMSEMEKRPANFS